LCKSEGIPVPADDAEILRVYHRNGLDCGTKKVLDALKDRNT
jgi:hypothetical protein